MISKHEMDMILAVVRDYVTSLMGRYTPSEVVLANFEEEQMQSYSGYNKVNQGTIRELIKAVKQAFAALPAPSAAPEEMKYANGNLVFEVRGNDLLIKDYRGAVCISVDGTGVHILEDMSVSRDLRLSSVAQQAVRIELTQQDLDDLWT